MSAISVEKMGTIDVGRQGENLARTIEFDVSSLLAKWPGAKITLLVKRKGDPEPYFAEAKVEGHILKWPITEVETAVAGDGKIEIQAILGEVIEKSVTATFRVSASLSGSASEELPEVRPSWVDEVLAAAGNGGGSGVAGEGAFIVKTTKDDAGNSIADKTQEEIRAAVAADMVCVLLGSNNSRVYYYCGERTVESDESQGLCPTFVAPVNYVAGEGIIFNQAHVLADGKININGWSPMHTPNPHNLLLWQGKKAKIYNGSELVEVEIPPVNAEPNKFLATDEDGNMSWVDRTDVSSDIVILPETEMAFDNSPVCSIATPFANKPTLGGTYKIIWDGVEYTTSNMVDATNTLGEGVMACYALGNADLLGFTELLGANPDASANIFLALIPDGQQPEDETLYGLLAVSSEPVTTTAVLSIVQTEGGSEDQTKQITLTIDEDGNVTSDTNFETAWAMSSAELQGSIVVRDINSTYILYGGVADLSVVSVARLSHSSDLFSQNVLQIRCMRFRDWTDATLQRDWFVCINWAKTSANGASETNISLGASIVGLPDLVTNDPDRGKIYYLRGVAGSYWTTVTLDEMKAELGQAGGTYLVSVTLETEDLQTFTNRTADKTYAEIKTAYDAGMFVFCRVSIKTGGNVAEQSEWNLSGIDSYTPSFVFHCNGGALRNQYIQISESGVGSPFTD